MQFLVIKLDWCTMFSKVYVFFTVVDTCTDLFKHHVFLVSSPLNKPYPHVMWVFLLLEDCYPFRAKGIEIGLQSACSFKVYTHSKFAVFSLPQHFQQLNPGMILRLQSASPTNYISILLWKAKAVPYFDCSTICDSQYFSISLSWNNALMQELKQNKWFSFDLTWKHYILSAFLFNLFHQMWDSHPVQTCFQILQTKSYRFAYECLPYESSPNIQGFWQIHEKP